MHRLVSMKMYRYWFGNGIIEHHLYTLLPSWKKSKRLFWKLYVSLEFHHIVFQIDCRVDSKSALKDVVIDGTHTPPRWR